MKPARSLIPGWIHHLPKERRSALLTALALTGMLCSLMLSGRWQGGMPAQPGSDGAAAVPSTEAESLEPGALPADAPSPGTAASAAEETPAEPVTLQMPLTGEPEVIQAYAFVFSPFYADYRLHPGIDFAAEAGQAVLAAADGQVVAVETDPAEGMALVLDHGGGFMTRYAGLERATARPGTAVTQGSRLGTVGRPGNGARPFLHFEVLQDGESLDPSAYLFQ